MCVDQLNVKTRWALRWGCDDCGPGAVPAQANPLYRGQPPKAQDFTVKTRAVVEIYAITNGLSTLVTCLKTWQADARNRGSSAGGSDDNTCTHDHCHQNSQAQNGRMLH